MSDNVVNFPNPHPPRQTADVSPGARLRAAVAGADLTPRPLDRVELSLLSLLALVLIDRGRLRETLRRVAFHLNASGLDADPDVVAGLRLALDGLALLHAARRAVDRRDAREKMRLLIDLPVSDGHVAVAIEACVEADRRALRMRRSDLA